LNLNTRPFGTRLIVALILIVPLVLLAWLGHRSLTQDRIVAEHQSTELAQARLREAQTVVHSFINELQQSAVTALSSLEIQDTISSDNISLIRQVVNADPFLEQVFILNAERRLLFPQDTVIHSNTERSFAESFMSVLNDENTFRAKPPSERYIAPASKSRYREKVSSRLSFDRVSSISKTVATAKQDIYLWHRTSNNILIGQKLSSAYWLSQLIARLPSDVGEDQLKDASIRLIDKRQRIIYQWGDFALNDPSAEQTNISPISKDWLTYCLDWNWCTNDLARVPPRNA